MKIGLLTDSHYSSAEFTCGRRSNNRSLAKSEQAISAVQASGDVSMGNHDSCILTQEAFYGVLGEE